MNPMLSLPDITSAANTKHPSTLKWVGMSDISVPFSVATSATDSTQVSAKADIYVSLDNPQAKGIHMSRLYRLLYQQLAQSDLSAEKISDVLDASIKSQHGISHNAQLKLYFDLPLRKPALLSQQAGYQSYQVSLTYTQRSNSRHTDIEMTIPYSSTCPCSASLSQQLLAKAIEQNFHSPAIEKQALLDWIQSQHGSIATPHSQRSYAHILMRWKDITCPDLRELITHFESVIGTPVQTAVKREDEQEFARMNAKNLLFCEDAARRLKSALNEFDSLIGYQFKVDHQESLHAHNAVVLDSKGFDE